MIKIAVFLMVCCFSYLATSQAHCQIAPDCKEIIKNYYKRDIVGVRFPKGKNVYFYNLLFEPEIDGYTAGVKKAVNIKMYISENQMHYITDDLSAFQDKQDAFLVINNPKMIVRSQSSINQRNDKLMSEFQIFSDSVIASGRVSDCKSSVNSKKEKLLFITLETGDKAKEAMNVERMVYQVNKQLDKIEKITMYYVKGYKYKKTVLTYIETNLNCKRDMSVPVRRFFYDANGRLIKKYASYKIVDNR